MAAIIEWYVKTKQILRSLERKAKDARRLYEEGGKEASAAVNGYLKTDLQHLRDYWLGRYPSASRTFEHLAKHIGFGMDGDYADMLRIDIPTLEEQAEARLLADAASQHFGFEELLHPRIENSSSQLYRDDTCEKLC